MNTLLNNIVFASLVLLLKTGCYNMTLFLVLFMFLVIMFIVYFDYMLSIARLSLCSSISSYSALFDVH
jgi:hypothetical protein